MSRCRIKNQNAQHSQFYLITNRVAGGYHCLEDLDKEQLLKVIRSAEERLGCFCHEYVLLDNHYHLLIETACPTAMSEKELLQKYQMSHRPLKDPSSEILQSFRDKIHDISYVVGNIEQRFAQWYNKNHDRKGHLFGARFDSSLIEESLHLLAPILYIILNPVRAGIVIDPKDYHWCSYGQRLAGKHFIGDKSYFSTLLKATDQENPLLTKDLSTQRSEILQWFRFLLMEKPQFKKENSLLLEEALIKAGKTVELNYGDLCWHKATFLCRGAVIGSELFVNKMIRQCQNKFKRKRKAIDHHGLFSFYFVYNPLLVCRLRDYPPAYGRTLIL